MIKLIYERPSKDLFSKRDRYDFMTFNYPRQLIRFLRNMGNFRILEINLLENR